MQFEVIIHDSVFEISLHLDNTRATVNNNEVEFQIVEQTNSQILFRIGTKLYKIRNIQVDGGKIECTINGRWISATIKNEQQLLLEKLGFKTTAEKSIGSLQAPMPGKILELLSAEGDEVELGDPVAILEAMKMENELKAPCAGTILSISVTTGSNVEKNQLLLEIEPRG